MTTHDEFVYKNSIAHSYHAEIVAKFLNGLTAEDTKKKFNKLGEELHLIWGEWFQVTKPHVLQNSGIVNGNSSIPSTEFCEI